MSNILKPTLQADGKLQLHVSGGLTGGWQDWEVNLLNLPPSMAGLFVELGQKAFDDYHAERAHYIRRLKTRRSRQRDGSVVTLEYRDAQANAHTFRLCEDDMTQSMNQLVAAIQQRGVEVKPGSPSHEGKAR